MKLTLRENHIFLMFEIRNVYIRRTYKFISALLSLLLCVSVLFNGFSGSEITGNSSLLNMPTTVSGKTLQHFALQTREIFEEEETERASVFSVETLPFVTALVLSLLTVSITRKVIVSPPFTQYSYWSIPIYIRVENYRL